MCWEETNKNTGQQVGVKYHTCHTVARKSTVLNLWYYSVQYTVCQGQNMPRHDFSVIKCHVTG